MYQPRQTKSIQPNLPTISWGYMSITNPKPSSLGNNFFQSKSKYMNNNKHHAQKQNINTSLELVQRLAASFWALLIPQIFAVVMLCEVTHPKGPQFQSRVLQQATTKNMINFQSQRILGEQIVVELFNSLLPSTPKILCWKNTKVKFLWLKNYYYYYYYYYWDKLI